VSAFILSSDTSTSSRATFWDHSDAFWRQPFSASATGQHVVRTATRTIGLLRLGLRRLDVGEESELLALGRLLSQR
jgi:hypothetical protein